MGRTERRLDGFNLEGTRGTGGRAGVPVDQEAILKASRLTVQWEKPKEQLQGKDKQCIEGTRSIWFKMIKHQNKSLLLTVTVSDLH